LTRKGKLKEKKRKRRLLPSTKGKKKIATLTPSRRRGGGEEDSRPRKTTSEEGKKKKATSPLLEVSLPKYQQRRRPIPTRANTSGRKRKRCIPQFFTFLTEKNEPKKR